MRKTLTLSIHVPFCPGHCGYCDKKVYTGTGTSVKESLVQAILREVDAIAPEMEDYTVNCIRFTGGCAVILGASVLRELIGHIRRTFSVGDGLEITLRSAPTHINIDILDTLTRYGKTHIELEQETFDPLLHLSLEQYFPIGAIEDCLNLLRSDSRISIGLRLLYGLQGQGIPSLLSSINSSTDANVITLRPLRISPGTCIEAEYLHCQREPSTSPRRIFPDREKQRSLYFAGAEHLAQLGYERCTPFHFAKPGKEPVYISNRCRGCDVLGIGPGAVSCYDGIYCRNKDSIEEYMSFSDNYIKIAEEMKALSEEMLQAKAVLTGLYGRDGWNMRDFSFGTDVFSAFPKLSIWKEQGLIKHEGERILLTQEGAFAFPLIRSELMAGEKESS